MYELLATGVSPQWLQQAAAKGYDLGTRNTEDVVKESINKLNAEEAKLENTKLTRFAFNPDDPQSLNDFITAVKSKKWDGIAFGGGVRTILELEEFFEKIINIAKDEQPQARFVFPILPGEVFAAFKRQIPDLS